MSKRVTEITLSLPFGLGGVTIEISRAERHAAWKLYVEFATRISTQPLPPGAGSVREALSSLHALYGITREVLKEAGPEIGESPSGLGPVAIRVLNEGLRPFITRWHAAYGDFERVAALELATAHGLRGAPVELVDQAGWSGLDAFHAELETVRGELRTYVHQLAMIASVERPG